MLSNKRKLTTKRFASTVAARSAGALALLLAMLLGGCGTSWLLMNDVRDFIDDSAPLQIWSGEVRKGKAGAEWQDCTRVPGALVVIKSISTAAPHNGGEAHEVSAASNARCTATPPEEKTDTHVGYTDSEGKYRIYFKWYKDRDYTIEAVLLDPDGSTWYDKVDRGKITWQDHETDLQLEPYSKLPEDAPVITDTGDSALDE